jgi:ferritin-like protein
MQPTPIMKHFRHAHLPDPLQEISRPFGDLAGLMSATLPDGPEKSAGLRKLLEAKDCAVRAKLEKIEAQAEAAKGGAA